MAHTEFNLLHAVTLVIAGCTAGIMNAIAGGGTLVSFPTLVWVGLPSIVANATSTIALLPATAGGTFGYRTKIRSVSRWLKLFAPVSLIGGLLGGILLVQTPSRVFDSLIPFLLLFATVLFMGQSVFAKIFGVQLTHDRPLSRKWIYGSVAFQFAVAVYGGYFGAGIGILMLASLGMLGFEDIHEMNTLKVILGFLINVIAAVYFIASGLVSWGDALMMSFGAVIGGYGGAHFAQQVSQKKVRTAITLIGLAISAVMFFREFSP